MNIAASVVSPPYIQQVGSMSIYRHGAHTMLYGRLPNMMSTVVFAVLLGSQQC